MALNQGAESVAGPWTKYGGPGSAAPSAQRRYPLDQLERALRQADAAGNVEDATALANAYRQERDLQRQESAQSAQGFTEVELPDGQVVEFPQGTDRATMERALQEYHARSAGGRPWEKYQQGPGQRGGMGEAIPPLPPGFVMEGEAPQSDTGMPPLPPGFELMQDDGPGLEIDIVGGRPVSASEFEASEQARQPNQSLFRADSDFRKRSGASMGNMLAGAARDMFGSREGAAEYIAKEVGGKVGQDSDGSPIVILPSGESYRLNDAGADMTDVANVAGNVAAFWTPASWAARLAKARQTGVLGRTAMQAGAAGATDVALQAGFNDGNVDAGRTAMAAAGGGAGELAGTGLGVLAARGSQAYRGITGARAAEGNRLAQLAGVATPAPPSRLASLAAGADEIQAGADPNAIVGRERFGFQYTQGQRTLDPARRFDQLSREEVLQNQPGAAHVFEGMQRHNQQQLGQAVSDIGERLGGRPGATPAELTQGAASRLQQQADELGGRVSAAYEQAGAGGRAAVDAQAVKALPDRLSQAVADFAPNPDLTPATARTLAQLREAAAKTTTGPDGASVKGVTLKAIETQRRIINNNVGAAANPTDRAAMMAVKREFDGWLDEAVEGALVSGDPAALQSLKDARALRFEFGRRFEGKGDADKFIVGLLDGTKTAEELINVALGASSVSKAGGARFIERLRAAADGDPQVIGALRAAHFQRLAVGKGGEPLPMAQIVRNIKTTEYSNASVLKALYSPKEWAEIRGLALVLDPIIPKGNFARSSGTTERLTRMMFQRIGGGLPLIGEMVQGIGSVRATVQANRAINQPLKLKAQAPTGFVPASTAGAVEYAR